MEFIIELEVDEDLWTIFTYKISPGFKKFNTRSINMIILWLIWA